MFVANDADASKDAVISALRLTFNVVSDAATDAE
jgi:hypothetical protein